jgi:hypothetical protein
MGSFEFALYLRVLLGAVVPAYSLYAHSAGYTEQGPYGHILPGRWNATLTS